MPELAGHVPWFAAMSAVLNIELPDFLVRANAGALVLPRDHERMRFVLGLAGENIAAEGARLPLRSSTLDGPAAGSGVNRRVAWAFLRPRPK